MFVPQRCDRSSAGRGGRFLVVRLCEYAVMDGARQHPAADDPVEVLQTCARQASIASARLLTAVLAVADDAKPGFAADEVAFALAWTQSAARSQVEFGRYLTRSLPDVFAALAAGDIDVRRAWVFADVLAPVDDPVAAAIAGVVLPHAGGLTTSQLRDRLRRAVLKADPDAAARTAKSVNDRHVVCTPDGEGTATVLGARLPAATLDQLRADIFLDLLEGVGVGSSPVHRAGVIELTVPWTTATGAADEPAVLAGYGPIDAQTARDIIAAHLPYVGRIRWRHTLTGDDGTLLNTTSLRRPTPPPASRPAHRPSLAEPQPARTRSSRRRAGRRGSKRGAAPPMPAPRPPVEDDPTQRSPGNPLARWIVTRDRTCRAPGCRVPARAADIDHTIDHATGGPTSHDNLAVTCRHHHRLKHEGGWRVTQPTPGTLVWISPTGHTYTTTSDPP